MVDIENILSRLDKVRSTSKNQWVACCPAHDDKNPSLGIKFREDGSILLTCFSGCDRKDVLRSLGLKFHDVMLGRKIEYEGNTYGYTRGAYDERGGEWNYRTGLCVLFLSVTLLEKALEKVGLGIKLSEDEKIALFTSANKVKNLFGSTSSRGSRNEF